jgi:hypothetical protein
MHPLLTAKRAAGASDGGSKTQETPSVWAALDRWAAPWYALPKMNRAVCKYLVALLAVCEAGCTFYTACPAGTGNGTTSGGGGSSGTGGGTAGGSSLITGTVPMGDWVNVTSNLAGMNSQCGNMSHVAAKPDEDMLIAGIGGLGLWASTDGGQTWQPLGTGAGSDEIDNRATTMLFDPAHTQVFWESGIYGAGVFKTVDDGVTFKELGMIQHNETLSIDFADPDRKTMIVGGHEQTQVLWLSTDAGDTWQSLGDKVPESADISSNPLLLDPQTFLLGCPPYAQKTPGIYRSTDAGNTWALVSTTGGEFAPLAASDGTIYWADPGNGGMVRSTDQGLTWTELIGPNALLSVAPIELPDGRIATASMQNIVVSSDQGAHWQIVSPALPYAPAGLTYSIQQKAFVIYHWTCDNPVPSDAIMRFDFDYQAN